MAKPNSFRHPVDARNDEKLAALIGDHGPTGYGVYWMIVEMLYRRESMRIEYCEKMIRRMAAQVGIKYSQFDQLLIDLIHHYELFAVEDGFMSSTLIYRKPRSRRSQPNGIANVNAPEQSANTTPEENNTGSYEPGISNTSLPRNNGSNATAEDMAAYKHPTRYEEAKMMMHPSGKQQPGDNRTAAYTQAGDRCAASEQQASSKQTTGEQQASSSLTASKTRVKQRLKDYYSAIQRVFAVPALFLQPLYTGNQA